MVYSERLADLGADMNAHLIAEDSLSISLTNCTVTHRDGRVTQLDQVSSFRFATDNVKELCLIG